MSELRNPNLIMADLSYRVIGACYDAFDRIGPNRKERHYQRAVATCLKNLDIRFVEQRSCPVLLENKKLADQYLDFLIEEKLILEPKVSNRFRKQDFDQTNAYLATTNLQLALLIRFDATGVTIRRVVNL